MKKAVYIWCFSYITGFIIDPAASFSPSSTWKTSKLVNSIAGKRKTQHHTTISATVDNLKDSSSTIISTKQAPPVKMPTSCKYCGEEFPSRNALFRHLRTSVDCYNQAQKEKNNDDASNKFSIIELQKRKVAIHFGYRNMKTDPQQKKKNDFAMTKGVNEIAAEIVRETFIEALKDLFPSCPVEDDTSTLTVATAARLRHPILLQEKDCSASSDVAGINYKGGPDDELMTDKSIANQMQKIINEKSYVKDLALEIQVMNVKPLSVSTKFHAEKDCTQRSYQYIVPMKWIDDTPESHEWVRKVVTRESVNNDNQQMRHGSTPLSIVRLKQVLKLAESLDMSSESTDTNQVPSPGRFGQLAKKERKAWHNFCDPSLGGMASPSNEPIWRNVDRACLREFIIDTDNNNEAMLVIEIRGDSFVTGQVRRIVGAAITITNQWVPENFFQTATRSDVCIETPVAPSNLLYCGSARYHFLELAKNFDLFGNGNEESNNWVRVLRSQLLKERLRSIEEEKKWLEELENGICMRIHKQLDKVKSDDEKRLEKQKLEMKTRTQPSLGKDVTFTEAPAVYNKTLSLLRQICNERKWPLTSAARSRVIRTPVALNGNEESKATTTQSGASSTFQGYLQQCGSFTVTNNQIFEGKTPLGNGLFPELVDSIFELEAELALHELPAADGMGSSVRSGKRKASTHCAVNRNAEFTPHVDSGKGQGQSLSMIVGLGDYVEGGLSVEGKSYDIRYKALEFDGWKQIHSTEPFDGERFSLVWFTPEKRGEVVDGEINIEDTEAQALVDKHTVLLPTYPELKLRRNSTDALVVKEILDLVEGCCYEQSAKSLWNMTVSSVQESQKAFSVKGHEAILDIGAHIGVFSRYALSVGCKQVFAYEPEVENYNLLKENLTPLDNHLGAVKTYNCAVAQGNVGMKRLVHARNRNDGSLNTWRHSLEDYTQYIDREGAKLSVDQASILTRSEVRVIPFFGPEGALKAGITFVKMDNEGAEIDILLSEECSSRSSWLDVTNLVFEWSFTKERRVGRFHQAVQNLESAGFTIAYEGQGSWWDTAENSMWPYHNDIVCFAVRQV